MLKKTVTTFLLMSCLCFSLPAAAVIHQIIKQNEAVEADRVKIVFNEKKIAVKVRAEGCEKCPIELSVTDQTLFFHNGNPVNPKESNALSGTPATVIYDATNAQAIKIKW